jgi:hypothetical protein
MEWSMNARKLGKKWFLAGLVFSGLIILTPLSFAQPFSADNQGNYFNKDWLYWEVNDQTGLNVRSSQELIAMLQRPRSQWKRVDPTKWAPRWMLPQGYMVKAKSIQGSVLLTDIRSNPWIITDLGAGGIGVVRANSNFVSPPYWQEPLYPDSNGDYSSAYRTQHMYWEIVDPDPAGLNLRMLPEFAKTYDSADGDTPSGPVSSWPVVGQVYKGTILRSVASNLGTMGFTDSNGANWLLVYRRPTDTWHNHDNVAFVRANAKFIRPIAGPLMKP